MLDSNYENDSDAVVSVDQSDLSRLVKIRSHFAVNNNLRRSKIFTTFFSPVYIGLYELSYEWSIISPSRNECTESCLF